MISIQVARFDNTGDNALGRLRFISHFSGELIADPTFTEHLTNHAQWVVRTSLAYWDAVQNGVMRSALAGVRQPRKRSEDRNHACHRERMTPALFQWTRSNLLGLCLLLVVGAPVLAVTISGKILDNETGESVPGASIQVVGTNRGAAANVEGLFSIPDLTQGTIELKITAVGYSPLIKTLVLTDSKDQHLTFKLASQAVPMGEVIVETKETSQRDFTPHVAQFSLPAKELAMLPQVVESDLFRSLQIVPGVLPSSDFSADLNIWGGSSDQNLILLNGIDVYKPTHLGGLFSIFSMDAVKDVKLIKGGFGAKYGGRLSAVVDVADREGNRNISSFKQCYGGGTPAQGIMAGVRPPNVSGLGHENAQE
jgi:CarboxypepD_reg-like domain/TonB-dependent Receptor Plug Domain